MAKLLMISTDRLIFDKKSAVRARHTGYAANFDEVHIIIFAKKGQYPAHDSLASNCHAYSTDSFCRLMYSRDAASLGGNIINVNGITDIICQDSSLTALAGIKLSRKFGLPLEIQIHEDLGSPNYVYKLSNKVRKFLAKRNIPKAAKVRVVSNRIKDYLTGELGISSEKIEVRPIAVDLSSVRNASVIEAANLHRKYPQFDKVILMASRLEPEKNIGMAIEAMKKVVATFPKAGLIIVGKGSSQIKLSKLAMSLGIESNIVFEPWADKDALYSYYKTADLFLNTSLFEGYGMSIVEATYAGLPVISTDVGVAKDQGATLVDFNPDDLSQKIIAFFSNK